MQTCTAAKQQQSGHTLGLLMQGSQLAQAPIAVSSGLSHHNKSHARVLGQRSFKPVQVVQLGGGQQHYALA